MEYTKDSFINEQLWKAVPGFPCYEAHPTGLIRNAITGKGISSWMSKGGNGTVDYPYVNVRNEAGNRTTCAVHRLIAMTFINVPAIDEWNWQVDHINHVPTDNDVRNLRWLPAKLNQILRTNVRPEIARRKILEYYRAHDIDYDYFNLLSEI